MTLRTYLFGMTISTILCFSAFLLVVFYINPEEAGFIGLMLFFLMLFLFLSGFFTIIGFYLRRKFLRNRIEFKQIGITFRQGIFFSLFFSGMLMLQKMGILFWWSAVLFIIVISLLEFYFVNKN